MSDRGRVLACFHGFSSDFSVVRVLDVNRLSSPLDTDIWGGRCSDNHITPSSKMAAIGFSHQNTVHVYAINENGIIDKRSLSTIKSDTASSSRFGESVALSDSGMSLAVSSPDLILNSSKFGALYVYVWLNDTWSPIESILYGMSNNQFLGSGGIAVDDVEGRIDVQQSDNSHRSFKVSTFFVSLRI